MGIGRKQCSDLDPPCPDLWSVNRARSEPEAGVETLATGQVVPKPNIVVINKKMFGAVSPPGSDIILGRCGQQSMTLNAGAGGRCS